MKRIAAIILSNESVLDKIAFDCSRFNRAKHRVWSFYLLVRKLKYRYNTLKYVVCLGQMSTKKRREIIRQKPSPALWLCTRGFDVGFRVFTTILDDNRAFPAPPPPEREGFLSAEIFRLITDDEGRTKEGVSVLLGRRRRVERRNSFNRWPRRPVHPRGIKLYYTHTHTHQIFNYFSGIMGRARGSRVV